MSKRRSYLGWRLVDIGEGRIHIFPTFGREHITDQSCWCGPRMELVEGGKIIIHGAEQ